MFGKHTAFIVPSYIATFLVIALLIVWIVMVYRKRRREIADLEARGFHRAGSVKGGSTEVKTGK